MRTLSSSGLLVLWERGRARHALDRSALLCAWARPELPVDAVADLPLGEITASLLRLRSTLFGDRIDAYLRCERCEERLALTVDVREVLQPDTAPRDVEAAGGRYRLPCLRDLAAIARERDVALAARQLLARCLLTPATDEVALLSEVNLREVEEALEKADPNANLAFEVCCSSCGHFGTAQLDAGELLWDEIEARARALLAEVDLLARAYGWTESDILSLSSARRASYLSMVAP